MKITKARLKQIIKEELEEVNLYHKADGTWGRKKTGNVRSISSKAAKRNNIDPKYVGKSIVAKDTDKVRKKYGMDRCGRQTVSGEPRNPVYSCKDAPKKYRNEDKIVREEEEDISGEDRIDREYIAGVIRMEIDKLIRSMNTKTRSACSLSDVIATMNKYELASRAKLNDPAS